MARISREISSQDLRAVRTPKLQLSEASLKERLLNRESAELSQNRAKNYLAKWLKKQNLTNNEIFFDEK